tara:strand:- start:11453 stop:12352 length:900 start_codon:yes stop_codon:yes gene_type:complete
MMIFGDNDFQFSVDTNWGDLPEGFEFHQVAGVAVDSDDQVYLFNRSSHQVMVFARNGNFVRTWDKKFAGPHGMLIGDDGNLFFVDRDDHVIYKYNKNQELLLTLGVVGTPSATGYSSDQEGFLVKNAGGPFNLPTGIAVNSEGEMFISDGYGNCRVHKYSSSGLLLTSWGEPGTKNPLQFNLPHGITIDSKNRVLVCDRENHRIQIFDQNGEFETMWSGFRQPTDITEGPGGEFYISELQHRLTIVDAKGKILTQWGGESSRDVGMFVAPHSVAVDSFGDIYVGEVLEGKRIQKFIRKR